MSFNYRVNFLSCMVNFFWLGGGGVVVNLLSSSTKEMKRASIRKLSQLKIGKMENGLERGWRMIGRLHGVFIS